ncbi:hypothetical protein EWM64_g3072 [Hericium alpestre]|uniref:Topoisomerase 6 subunit A/Spo11 TOPRIM domain-containing protein n=1 Tax=Hericium alpestre TaxID=135208 RepID=A0A4Z0A4V6_9AGAM|nr:hypothetical protein EWM64_g3072 [Hericium alpestre]
MFSSDYFEDVFSVWPQEQDDTLMLLDDAEEEQDDFIFDEYRPLSPALRIEDSDEDEESHAPENPSEELHASVKVEEGQTSKLIFSDDSDDDEGHGPEACEEDGESEEEAEQHESDTDNPAEFVIALSIGTTLTVHNEMKGKGYPDLATRQLVRTLSDNLPEDVPILALVDGDAFGLDIVSVYKFGSHALRHENERLAADRVECTGVWASELPGWIQYLMNSQARAMLLRSSDKMPTQWKRELMHMLHTRRKAETEILSNIGSNIFGDLDLSVPSGSSTPCSSQPNVALVTHPLVRYLATKIKACILSGSDDIVVLD